MDITIDSITAGEVDAEISRRTVAALAATTAGKAGVVESKKVYRRSKVRKETKEIVRETDVG